MRDEGASWVCEGAVTGWVREGTAVAGQVREGVAVGVVLEALLRWLVVCLPVSFFLGDGRLVGGRLLRRSKVPCPCWWKIFTPSSVIGLVLPPGIPLQCHILPSLLLECRPP